MARAALHPSVRVALASRLLARQAARACAARASCAWSWSWTLSAAAVWPPWGDECVAGGLADTSHGTGTTGFDDTVGASTARLVHAWPRGSFVEQAFRDPHAVTSSAHTSASSHVRGCGGPWPPVACGRCTACPRRGRLQPHVQVSQAYSATGGRALP